LFHPTVRQIDPAAWDLLAGDNAFATHGWLLTAETTCRAPVQPLYLTLVDNGALIAGAVCYVVDPSHPIETLDHMLFGRLYKFAR
jgi:hypothetical protein